MKWLRTLALLGSLASTVVANEIKVSDKMEERHQCAGIYSKQDWGGSFDSFIDVALKPVDKKSGGKDDSQNWVALAILEYRNFDRLGVPISGENDLKYVCDRSAVDNKLCTEDQYGEFILRDATGLPPLYAAIHTQKIDLAKPEAVKYPVKRTGFYCVLTYPVPDSVSYEGIAVYQNAYGYLAASQIPKLPFYGGAALAYLVVFALWMFSYVQHRADILPVQNYITAICGFLVVEMIVIWGYYDLVNNHGTSAGSVAYLVVVSIFNSFRNSFTFFLLLIVCMGYGVVKPSLGNTMWKCRALALAHFVFAVIYTISSYVIAPEDAGPYVLFIMLPLTLTMTAFYVWILSSITSTIQFLNQRKQHVKARMYRLLWSILLGSIIVIFIFFFINSLIFAHASFLEFVTEYWKSRWFLLDGWLNVVYFIDFCLIAFIWRPTANNRRFAMSSQLAQDENDAQEFEIGSLRESLDEEERTGEGQEHGNGHSSSTDDDFGPDAVRPDITSSAFSHSPPPYDGRRDSDDKRPAALKIFGSASSLSSKKTKNSDKNSETVFEVGDDDDDFGIDENHSLAGANGASSSSRRVQWQDDQDDYDANSILSDDDNEETEHLRKKKDD